MSLMKEIERITKAKHVRALKILMRQYGVNIDVFTPQETVHTSVYGREADSTNVISRTIRGIVVGDDFFPSNSISTGTFQTGFLYTLDHNEIKVGSTVAVQRVDGKSMKYKVNEKQQYGTTTEVFTRYELSALGD